MVYTYTPTYYSSLHESITSICKTVLPFSLKKRRLPAIATSEQRLSKQQSDNLKWQQDSFHQILNLIGLCKEGIVPLNEVSAFRTHLLETLIASPIDHEPPLILRDKLIFLQELVYAKCISEEEYHASKRPLLQRLAVQGAEIEARDVIVGAHKEASNDEWSEIDLKDDSQEYISTSKSRSTVKRMRGAASLLGYVSSDRNGKLKEKGANSASSKSNPSEVGWCTQNPFWNGKSDERENGFESILMEESLQSVGEKGRKTPLRAAFRREEDQNPAEEKEKVKLGKRGGWVFDGFKKWRKNESRDEIARFSSVDEESDEACYDGKLVRNPVGEGPDTRQIKRKLHPNGAPTDFFVDKVVAENIKKQLCKISARNPDLHLTDDEIEAISMRLPVDKVDLEKFFPRSWCDQYGDVVLDLVRKEFKEHMREMGNQRGGEKHNKFEDENSHPNLNSHCYKQANLSISSRARSHVNSSSIDKGFKYNPFFDM
ncbi:hypothetical protein C2S51_010783 [Perilla frutescens var. frutescens]|nr:hypothetical protein C2S51_010783 [Perilla frutescens var. frutescens]